jgi:hypothetical protein
LNLDLPIDQPADRVVTFNYDDLLDQHLIKKFDPTQIYFDRIKKDADGSKTAKAGAHPYPMLVKLHGSVNWRCKDEDFQKILKGEMTKEVSENKGEGGKNKEKSIELNQIWMSQVGTPRPEDSVFPLMVPPTPVKPITSISLFRYLWTIAYEYLHDAEEIVVCGYSLPQADRLAASLFSNFSNKILAKVTVVDPNPAILSKWRTLFGRKSVSAPHWEYFDDFRDYVERL